MKYAPCIVIGLAALIVFVVNVNHHFFYSDDCFISFRYARNLVNGNGLVWNTGERVEGYTNFLWVLIMAAGMKFDVQPELLSIVLTISSGVLLLAAMMWFIARHTGWLHPFPWILFLVMSLSRSYTAWCSSGLATQFFSFLAFLAFLAFLKERGKQAKYPILSAVLFSLATLTRPEGLLFTFVAGVFFLVDVIRKNRAFLSLVAWVLPYMIIIGAHFLWRFSYYGFWLPNTFYVKVSGLWLEQSLKFFTYFNQDYRIIWFVPLLFIPFIAKPAYSSYLFLAVICGQFLYLLYIGGDRFEFRFLVFIFPYLYLQIFAGLIALTEISWTASWRRYTAWIFVYGILAALCITTYLGSIRREAQDMRSYIMAIPGMKVYTERRMWEGKFLRNLIDEGVLPEDLYLSVGGAGAVPYYTMWPALDELGLNNLEIGRMKITKRGKIAHEKMATWEMLDEKKVEMCDGENRIVHDQPGKTGPTEGGVGRWISIRVGDHYLNFITFLSEDEFKQRFNNKRLQY